MTDQAYTTYEDTVTMSDVRVFVAALARGTKPKTRKAVEAAMRRYAGRTFEGNVIKLHGHAETVRRNRACENLLNMLNAPN